MDRSGRWHVVFIAVPVAIARPGNGEVVGIDRGVAVSAALSTGHMLNCPELRVTERARLLRLQRKLAKAKRGSNRRSQVKLAIAAIRASEKDRRKDWCEKVSTDLARRFDVIRVEDLKVKGMTRSAKGTLAKPGRNVRQLVTEYAADAEADEPGLTAAIAERIFGALKEWDTGYEEGAREALRDFEYRPEGDGSGSEPFRFADAWEWDLHDYDWQFLWCCHAIQWGISQYDKQKVTADA